MRQTIEDILKFFKYSVEFVELMLLGKYKQCIKCKQVFDRHDDSVGWHRNTCGNCYCAEHDAVIRRKQEINASRFNAMEEEDDTKR